MAKKQGILLSAIYVLGIIECLVEAIDHKVLRYVLKPAVMVLIIYRIHTAPGVASTPFVKLTKYGLMISIVGDILLLFKSQLLFECGTMAFLIAHLVYIASNLTKGVHDSPKPKTRVLPWVVLVVVYAAGLLHAWEMWNKLPNRPLFFSYMLVLSSMIVSAAFRLDRTSKKSFYLALFGAILFGVSDNMIAMFKFNGIKTQWGQSAIMATYYLGQLLICEAAIDHESSKQSQPKRL